MELETSSPAVGLAAGLAVWPAARKGQQPGQQPENRLPVFWPVAVGRLFFRLPVGGWLLAQTARQSNSRPLTPRTGVAALDLSTVPSNPKHLGSRSIYLSINPNRRLDLHFLDAVRCCPGGRSSSPPDRVGVGSSCASSRSALR